MVTSLLTLSSLSSPTPGQPAQASGVPTPRGHRCPCGQPTSCAVPTSTCGLQRRASLPLRLTVEPERARHPALSVALNVTDTPHSICSVLPHLCPARGTIVFKDACLSRSEEH